ncbi:uncharacterized protein METZ01_LOCUS169803 [marine metagenome]|uniref:Uncharacterized protein n=1 Tax=marine metagenome TaxID=408172 RepID=A0A382BTK9_9ZZZZ
MKLLEYDSVLEGGLRQPRRRNEHSQDPRGGLAQTGGAPHSSSPDGRENENDSHESRHEQAFDVTPPR